MTLSFYDFSPIISASGLQMALDQPFFPGKVVLWLLFMLSLMSWAVMASKLISLRKFQDGDRLFTKQLRMSKKPLEIHEKGWEAPMSLRQEVYNLGAKEAAFQLLGTIRRRKFDQKDDTGSLSDSQMASLREALNQGESAAQARLEIGMPVLQASAAGAPFLGLLGMVWLMMGSFSETTQEGVTSGISAGLAVMAIALIAATPAIFGQILLRSTFRTRMRELGDFRIELFRLFERALASAWQVDEEVEVQEARELQPQPEKSHAIAPTQSADAAPQPQERITFEVEKKSATQQPEPNTRRVVKKKVFKKIRQDEPMINPIAMQTKGAKS